MSFNTMPVRLAQILRLRVKTESYLMWIQHIQQKHYPAQQSRSVVAHFLQTFGPKFAKRRRRLTAILWPAQWKEKPADAQNTWGLPWPACLGTCYPPDTSDTESRMMKSRGETVGWSGSADWIGCHWYCTFYVKVLPLMDGQCWGWGRGHGQGCSVCGRCRCLPSTRWQEKRQELSHWCCPHWVVYLDLDTPRGIIKVITSRKYF